MSASTPTSKMTDEELYKSVTRELSTPGEPLPVNRDPINDAGHSYIIESRIAELGLQEPYEIALCGVVERGTGDGFLLFDVIHATPRQRCEAALVAVRASRQPSANPTATGIDTQPNP